MPVPTQGTDLYAIDPEDGSVIDVGCVTSIEGIDTQPENVDISCLQDRARRYMAGLQNPGTATFGLATDPSNPDHVRLLELKEAGETLKWAVGWSESPGTAPTVDSDQEFVTNPLRSWLLFEGYMNSFPFSFALNSVVTSNVGIQVSGEVVMVPVGS